MLSDKGTQPPSSAWTPAKLEQFIIDCEHAKEAGREIVLFEGHPINLGYAKYLIIYLEGAMK